MGKKDKTVIEQLRETVAQLKLEEAAGKEIELVIVAAEEEIKTLREEIAKIGGELSTASTQIVKLTGELDEANAQLKAASDQVSTLKEAKESAELKAKEAEEMLTEAAEQLENQVATKKGVAKTKVKVGDREYLVNPKRKITGVPGHGDRVFSGADVITNVAKVAHEGKEVGLKDYLAATGASILEPSNGRK